MQMDGRLAEKVLWRSEWTTRSYTEGFQLFSHKKAIRFMVQNLGVSLNLEKNKWARLWSFLCYLAGFNSFLLRAFGVFFLRIAKGNTGEYTF